MRKGPGRLSGPFAFVRARPRIAPVTFRTSCAGLGVQSWRPGLGVQVLASRSWRPGLGVQVPHAALNLFLPGPTNTHRGRTGPQPFQRETIMTIKSKIAAALAV